MKILNFGSMNLDYVYKVPHFVAPGETLAPLQMTVVPGGKGLNQSVALTRAGAKVWHAGAAGQGGEPLLTLLRENGVDTSFVFRTDTVQGNAVIQVDPEGENCILLYGGSNRAVTEAMADEVLSHFSAGDFLLLQNEISCLEVIIGKAAEKGMKLVFNPSPFEEKLREIDLSLLTWLLVNEVEAEMLTGETEPEKVGAVLRRRWPDLCTVLTLGGDGAVCFTPKETYVQGIYRVPVADTTAAGDCFTGYFIEGVTRGLPIGECLRRAAMAAALSVSREGASVSIPTAEEVDRALEKTWE